MTVTAPVAAYCPGARFGLPPAGLNSIASRTQRFHASLVDAGIFVAVGVPWFLGAGIGVVQVALFWLAVAAYEVGFVAVRGATPGKSLVGLKVIGTEPPHAKPDLRTAVVRWLVPAAVPGLLVDAAWLLWDPDRQCLHDKVAQTLVVRC